MGVPQGNKSQNGANGNRKLDDFVWHAFSHPVT